MELSQLAFPLPCGGSQLCFSHGMCCVFAIAVAPGKLSYGSYASFIAMLNFGWWLITIAVSLVMAASLCWLLVAFATSSAVSMGVR